MKDGRQLAHANSDTHDDRHFVDQFTRSSRDNGRAQDFVRSFVHVNLHETAVLSIRDCALNVLHHHRKTFDRDGLPPRLAHIHANVRDLRIAIGAPWNRQPTLPFYPCAERVLNRYSRRGFRNVGKLTRIAHVAGGIDIDIGCPEKLIDLNASCRLEIDAGDLKTQVLHIRHAPDTEQDFIDGDGIFEIIVDGIEQLCAAFHTSADHRGIQSCFYTV